MYQAALPPADLHALFEQRSSRWPAIPVEPRHARRPCAPLKYDALWSHPCSARCRSASHARSRHEKCVSLARNTRSTRATQPERSPPEKGKPRAIGGRKATGPEGIGIAGLPKEEGHRACRDGDLSQERGGS